MKFLWMFLIPFLLIISILAALFIKNYYEGKNIILKKSNCYVAYSKIYYFYIIRVKSLHYNLSKVKKYAMDNDYLIRSGDGPDYIYYKGNQLYIPAPGENMSEKFNRNKNVLYLYERRNSFSLRGEFEQAYATIWYEPLDPFDFKKFGFNFTPKKNMTSIEATRELKKISKIIGISSSPVKLWLLTFKFENCADIMEPK